MAAEAPQLSVVKLEALPPRLRRIAEEDRGEAERVVQTEEGMDARTAKIGVQNSYCAGKATNIS